MDDHWGKGIVLPSVPDVRSSVPFDKVLATIAEQLGGSSGVRPE